MAVGNTLGESRLVLYTDDTGQNYSIRQNLASATGVGNVLNDANPPAPRGVKLRGVYIENAAGARKFIVVGDITNATYDSNATQVVTIDGVAFNTTGRRGEAFSFSANPAPPPP